VAASGALKFQPGIRDGWRETDSATLRLENASIADFCGDLSRNTKRPVLDATGIAGTFDFEMHYGKGGDTSAPAITTALEQQLGLKLEPEKHPSTCSSSRTLSAGRQQS